MLFMGRIFPYNFSDAVIAPEIPPVFQCIGFIAILPKKKRFACWILCSVLPVLRKTCPFYFDFIDIPACNFDNKNKLCKA